MCGKISTLPEVDLTETYTTQRSETLSYDCPTLSFSYPASWYIADSSTAGYGELISLVNSEGTLEIKFAQWTGGSLHSYDFEYKNREKVADALFVPRNTETYESADKMGKLAVIKGKVIVDGKDEGICYALLPESALSNNRFLGAFNERPSFSYSSDVSFSCLIEEGRELSSQDEAEILAILGSLVDVDS